MGRPHGRPDLRRVKLHRSYTVAEAADLLDVHRNTVRHWIAKGLVTVRTTTGVLILGSDLRTYLAGRRREAKSPCPPGTMYCLRCRAPRQPPPGLVELVAGVGRYGNLRGICPACATLMHRRVGRGGPESAGFAWPPHASAPTPNR